MSKRVLAMALAILAFFIFVGSPFQQAAQAVAVVDDALIAIIIVALAAIGITFVTTGAFNSTEEYVESLFIEFANENSTTPDILFRGTQAGSDNLGRLILNNKFVVLISTFATWLKAKLNLVDNESLTLQSVGSSVAGMMVYETPLYVYRDVYGVEHLCYISITYNGVEVSDIYGVYTTTASMQAYITLTDYRGDTNLIFRYVDTHTGEVLSNQSFNNFGQVIGGYNITPWYVLTLTYGNSVHPVSGVTSYSQDHIGYILSHNSDVDFNPTGIKVTTGDIAIPLDDDNYTDGDGAIIDLGADWGTSYRDILDDVIPGEFSDSKEGEASIFYESDEVIEDQVVDTDQGSISQEVSDYQIPGLQNVFPFCIPFDIYAFFECLAAEPEAPSFVWRFYIPGICDEDIAIDLAAFDSAARILRTMELLLFIVGLAFVTRDKFLRG